MKKIIAAAVVALGMGGASAQSFSLGAALGQSNFKYDCSVSCDNEGNGAKVYIGYRINPFLSAEAGYAHFGTTSGGRETDQGMTNGKLRSYGVYLAAAGRLTLMKDLAATARLGVMKVNTRAELTGGYNGTYKESDFHPLMGLGFEATITQSTWATLNLDVTKSAAVLNDEDGTLRLITLGVRSEF